MNSVKGYFANLIKVKKNEIFIAFLISLTLLSSIIYAQARFHEDEVKAAFVYNFVRFINWPEDCESKDIIIAHSGNKPLSSNLKQLEGKMVGTRKIKVVHHKSIDVNKIQVFYVCS